MTLEQINSRLTEIEQSVDYDSDKLMENEEYKTLCSEACNSMTIKEFWLWCHRRSEREWKNHTL
jgi:hypothetical protein